MITPEVGQIYLCNHMVPNVHGYGSRIVDEYLKVESTHTFGLSYKLGSHPENSTISGIMGITSFNSSIESKELILYKEAKLEYKAPVNRLSLID